MKINYKTMQFSFWWPFFALAIICYLLGFSLGAVFGSPFIVWINTI